MDYLKQKRRKKIITPIIIAGACVAAVCIIGSFIRIKPVNNGDVAQVQQEGVSGDTYVEGEDFTLDSLSIKLPNGWTKIEREADKNAHTEAEFVHSASNSSLYIAEYDYDPSVNDFLSEEGCQTYAMNTYGNFASCEIKATDEVCVYYSRQTNARTYNCVDKFIWDREKIWYINVNINSYYYDRLASTMDYITESAEAQKQDPVREGTYIRYITESDAELAVPSEWQNNGNVFSKDKESLTIETLSQDTDIANYNISDYMKTFGITTISNVSYEGNYTVIDTENGKTFVVSGNGYTYFYIWESKDDTLMKNCIEQVRFHEKQETTQETSETITEISTKVNTDTTTITTDN